MKAQDIRVGMVLSLKPERQEAYGNESPLVTVTGFKQRPGYAVPYVRSNNDFYKPQDFAKFERWAETNTNKELTKCQS
jgi:hypothetical protein